MTDIATTARVRLELKASVSMVAYPAAQPREEVGSRLTAMIYRSAERIFAGRRTVVQPPAASTITKPAPRPATTTRPVTDDGDHDRFAHFIRKADSARAYVEGTPVRALCGKVWVPSRDPSRYPICPSCDEIRKRLVRRSNN